MKGTDLHAKLIENETSGFWADLLNDLINPQTPNIYHTK